eukprot:scaffold1363_cov30-Phaeocystis_antarctica.AAC.1
MGGKLLRLVEPFISTSGKLMDTSVAACYITAAGRHAAPLSVPAEFGRARHSLTVSDLQGYESDGEYDDLPERVACVCVCVCFCLCVCVCRVSVRARARARARNELTGEASAASNHYRGILLSADALPTPTTDASEVAPEKRAFGKKRRAADAATGHVCTGPVGSDGFRAAASPKGLLGLCAAGGEPGSRKNAGCLLQSSVRVAASARCRCGCASGGLGRAQAGDEQEDDSAEFGTPTSAKFQQSASASSGVAPESGRRWRRTPA